MPMNPRLLRPLARRQAPAPSDPYFSQVSLLLHMDGANGSTTFTDSSPENHTVTAYGDAQISTAESKFGGASGYFDGDGDYVAAPPSALPVGASEEWTLECWLYLPSVPTDVFSVCGQSSGAGDVPKWGLLCNANTGFTYEADKAGFFVYDGGNVWINQPFAWSANTWYHIAVAATNGSIFMYIDGTLVGDMTATLPAANTGDVRFGSDGENYKYTLGYIDELRITKGVNGARYTANFTPPTAPFPNQ